MNENEHNLHQYDGKNHNKVNHNRPYWKRAHHDWRFWVAVSLMFAGIMFYVMSDDLSWRPPVQPQHELGK